MKSIMKITTLFVLFTLGLTPFASAQPTVIEQEVISLSLDKWQWMADKNVEKLTPLFHPGAKFVHMGGTWTTDRELEIIESGSIWYKNATVHDTAIQLFGNTAVVWNRITLEAVVGGNEVKNEFTVTEVYQSEGGKWCMLAMTFSSVRDNHRIEH